MRTSDFDYPLPPERIAQTPVEPRHASRLLVLQRAEDRLEHRTFWDIGDYLRPGDLLVVNQTRVIPARIFGRKPTGGRIELLLLKRLDDTTWEALVGGKRVSPGMKAGPRRRAAGRNSRKSGRIAPIGTLQPTGRTVSGAGRADAAATLYPYPTQRPRALPDCVCPPAGSAAAPTAGLHFTPELMAHLSSQGIQFAQVTLHVGLDTFAPVTEDDPQTHAIHTEWCEVTPAAADLINTTRQKAGGSLPWAPPACAPWKLPLAAQFPAK